MPYLYTHFHHQCLGSFPTFFFSLPLLILSWTFPLVPYPIRIFTNVLFFLLFCLLFVDLTCLLPLFPFHNISLLLVILSLVSRSTFLVALFPFYLSVHPSSHQLILPASSLSSLPSHFCLYPSIYLFIYPLFLLSIIPVSFYSAAVTFILLSIRPSFNPPNLLFSSCTFTFPIRTRGSERAGHYGRAGFNRHR